VYDGLDELAALIDARIPVPDKGRGTIEKPDGDS
jgi:hypothetical protein